MGLVLISVILMIGSVVHYITIEDTPTMTVSKRKRREGRSNDYVTYDDDYENGEDFNATLISKVKRLNNPGEADFTIIPEAFNYLADIINPLRPEDVPFFWHIPRAGGSTLKDITAACLGLTQASHFGGTVEGHGNDKELRVIEDLERDAKYVNVDTSVLEGVERAKEMGIARFEPLDVIFSPLVAEMAEAFDQDHMGRMFALFRHPVDRAVSMYYYLNNDPKKREVLNGASLEEYARVGPVENNWMVRFLSNKPKGELTAENEAVAREVLRRKCVVGLLSRKAESFRRFENFFGWKVTGEKMEACHERLLIWDWSNKNKHPLIKEGTTIWKLLENYNTFDIRLYRYAEELFMEQATLFAETNDRPTYLY